MVAAKDYLQSAYYRCGNLRLSRALFRPCQGDAQIAMYHRVLPQELLGIKLSGWNAFWGRDW
jgi:hypothetical protein